MKISIIAAIGRNRELGKDNKLLWHIPEDLKRFKKLTQGHAVIMGRKTFESLGKPLPNRLNIIITRDKEYKVKSFDVSTRLPDGQEHQTYIVHSLKEAIILGGGSSEIFIIGGGQIYQQALPLAQKLYLTIVDVDRPDADTYFPDYSVFNKIIFSQQIQTDEYKIKFVELEKP